MRNIAALVTLLFLAACSRGHEEPASTDPSSGEFVGVAYYDRNKDGVADFELHMPDCDDCDWALIDANFNGRYDMHVIFGYSMIKKAVDSPVPEGVGLRDGEVPPYGWID